MNNDESEARPKLSKTQFYLAMNTYLHGTFICAQLNKLKANLVVDAEGNFPPDIVGAIHLVIRSVPGTEFSCAREIPAVRQMLNFLDPYLEPRYRPESDEIVPLLYIPQD